MPLSASTCRKRGLPLGQRRAAGRLDLGGPLRVDQGFRSARTREQNAAFLERLADRSDPETQGGRIESLAAGIKLRTAQ